MVRTLFPWTARYALDLSALESFCFLGGGTELFSFLFVGSSDGLSLAKPSPSGALPNLALFLAAFLASVEGNNGQNSQLNRRLIRQRVRPSTGPFRTCCLLPCVNLRDSKVNLVHADRTDSAEARNQLKKQICEFSGRSGSSNFDPGVWRI